MCLEISRRRERCYWCASSPPSGPANSLRASGAPIWAPGCVALRSFWPYRSWAWDSVGLPIRPNNSNMTFKQRSTYKQRSYRMTITSEQCRAARALLGLKQTELAKKSSVSAKTIADFEIGMRRPYAATLTVLKQTLEGVGVEFTDPIDGVCGSGVRFKWGLEPEPSKTSSGKGKGASDTKSLGGVRDSAEHQPGVSEGDRL